MKVINNEKNRRNGYVGCKCRLLTMYNGISYFEIDKDGRTLKFQCSEAKFNSNFAMEKGDEGLTAFESDPNSPELNKKDFKEY